MKLLSALLNVTFWTGTVIALSAITFVFAALLYVAAVRWFVGVVG